jgi:hypothetical protein
VRGTARWTIIVFRLKVCDVALATIYFWTGEGLSEKNLAHIVEVGIALQRTGLPWFLSGDWQMEPGLLASSQVCRHLGAEIVDMPGVEMTCTCGSGRNKDFALAARRGAPMLTFQELALETPWKPHFCCNPWLMMVRKARRPKPILPAEAGISPVWADCIDMATQHVAECNSSLLANPEQAQGRKDRPALPESLSLSVRFRQRTAALEIYHCEEGGVAEADRAKFMGRAGVLAIVEVF